MKLEELSHLQPPCREAALLSDDERIHWLRQERWIQYPRAERILERLLDLVDYPPRDRMPCLVVYGATGMGKTRIIQKFLRDNRLVSIRNSAGHAFPSYPSRCPRRRVSAISTRRFSAA